MASSGTVPFGTSAQNLGEGRFVMLGTAATAFKTYVDKTFPNDGGRTCSREIEGDWADDHFPQNLSILPKKVTTNKSTCITVVFALLFPSNRNSNNDPREGTKHWQCIGCPSK